MEKNQNSKIKVIHDDNLNALKKLKKEYLGSIDLIYIDPPFGTGSSFHIDDENVKTISKSKKDAIAYTDYLKGEEFVSYISERLSESYDLMSDCATIYVHIGNLYAPYIEIELNRIFGMNNRISKVARIKCNPKNSVMKSYGNIHDTVLIYAKNKGKHIWNEVKIPYTQKDIETLYKKKDNNGYYTTIPLHAPGESNRGETSKPWKGLNPPKGRHWRTSPSIMEEWDERGLIEWSSTGNPRKKMYAHEKIGKKIQDVWEFKDSTTYYPTEKNSDMLSMIIGMSSNIDSVVLDFFAGSGTTGFEAFKQGRKSILIDKSGEAIRVIKGRINDMDK